MWHIAFYLLKIHNPQYYMDIKHNKSVHYWFTKWPIRENITFQSDNFSIGKYKPNLPIEIISQLEKTNLQKFKSLSTRWQSCHRTNVEHAVDAVKQSKHHWHVWLQLNETAWIIVNIRTKTEKQRNVLISYMFFCCRVFFITFYFNRSLFSTPIIVNKIIASSNHLPHLPNVWWVFNSIPLNCNIFLRPARALFCTCMPL